MKQPHLIVFFFLFEYLAYLLQKLVPYDRKKFYNIATWCPIHNTLFSS